MDFGLIQQNQWSAFRVLAISARAIRLRAEQIIGLLVDAANAQSLLGKDAVEISPAEGDKLANVKTALGSGRIVLSWEVAGDELQGVMLFERERRDEYDRQFWEPVWGLRLPRYENPYSGSEGARVSLPLDLINFGPALPNAVFAALMSMLYGLVNGPVKG